MESLLKVFSENEIEVLKKACFIVTSKHAPEPKEINFY